jgi:hypothetical protein
MSVLRQGNWLGQQRVDVPHIRALESSIAADFDVLAGLILGGGSPMVVKGFNLSTTNAIGQPATSLQLVVANGLLIHYGASEAGSIFWVPSTRANETLSINNTNVTGSFNASSTNYIGLDLIRTSDTTTSDNVQFLDANSLLEISRNVPLGRTLNYRIVISVVPFSANTNICPVAKVVTDANNNVTSIVDARRLMYRLGSGGDVPSTSFAYAWPQGRNETTASDVFSGGDKALTNFGDWSDGIMTRLWEVGGGEFWYSPTADRNVRLFGEGAVLASGDYLAWSGTNLTWQNLVVIFGNSTGYYNELVNQTTTSAGLTDLAIGECLYVDLDRTQNRTRSGVTALQPVKGVLTTLGTPVVPGSRYVIAWRSANGNVIAKDRPFIVGAAQAATTSQLGSVELSATASVSNFPVVATVQTGGQANVTGLLRDATNTNSSGPLTYSASVGATGATAHIFDNFTGQTSGIIASFRTNGVEKAYIDWTGDFVATTAGGIFAQRGANSSIILSGNKTAGDSGADCIINGTVTRTAGTLLSVQNNSVEKVYIDFGGSIAQTVSGSIIAMVGSNASLFFRGNRNAGDTGSDVVLSSAVTRTAGNLVSIQNNGVEKLAIVFDGTIIQTQANTSVTIKGNRSAGDAGSDIVLNSIATRTAGKIVSFQNNGVEKGFVDFNGNFGPYALGFIEDFEVATFPPVATNSWATPSVNFGSDSAWVRTTTNPITSTASASAPVPQALSTNSSLGLTITLLSPSRVSFLWAVNCNQNNGDHLDFYVDGVLTAQFSTQVSNTLIGGRFMTDLIREGRHTFDWRFVRGGSASVGSEECKIDTVEIIPETFWQSDPGRLNFFDDCFGNATTNNNVAISATVDTTHSYPWVFNTSANTGIYFIGGNSGGNFESMGAISIQSANVAAADWASMRLEGSGAGFRASTLAIFGTMQTLVETRTLIASAGLQANSVYENGWVDSNPAGTQT